MSPAALAARISATLLVTRTGMAGSSCTRSHWPIRVTASPATAVPSRFHGTQARSLVLDMRGEVAWSAQ